MFPELSTHISLDPKWKVTEKENSKEKSDFTSELPATGTHRRYLCRVSMKDATTVFLGGSNRSLGFQRKEVGKRLN